MTARTLAVVLNWNGWSDTLTCLAALHRIDTPALDILVVDNGSTDGSTAHLLKQYPDLQLLQSGANLGFGGGCNLGIDHALRHGYTYVWLINNDAQVEPNCLQHLLGMMHTHPEVGAVGGVLFETHAPGHIQLWGGGRIHFGWGAAQACKTPSKLDTLSGACMLLRAQALRAVGKFDSHHYFMYWEDADLSLRLRAAGWQLAVAAQANLTHKLSASLGRGSATLDRYFVTSGIRFFRRHAPWPAWSTAVMLLRMLLLRVGKWQWPRVRAVWLGWKSA